MALSPSYCDACGSENRAQATFCFNCGQVLHIRNRTTSLQNTGLLPTNHLLKQRYRVLMKIGRGGFGAVYKAVDLLFGNRMVAIKEMSQVNLTSQELVEATHTFKHEAMLLASLTHPNLPRIYEQFADAGRWYLVMDYIEGETVEDYMLKVVGGKLSVDKVLSIGIQVCTVLEYLHSRQPPVIFRDLKPANIMLTPAGHIYLIDFGIARLFKPGQSRDTSALGSAGYAAPEQYGKAQTTPRADIYSLGATLHELLTGINPADSPFNFAPLRLQQHAAHRELELLVTQMVEVDPNKRPLTVAQVRQYLENIATLKASTAGSQYQTINQLAGGYHLSPALPQKRGTTQAQPMTLPQPLSNTRFIGSKHTSRVTSVAWSVRGTRIASASYDKTVRIWDAADGDNLITYKGHNQPVLALAWSPDGKRIASASEDKTIHIWDTISGQTLHMHRGHNTRILTLTWSSDGKNIASGGEDKLVQVWNLQREKTNFFTSWLFHARGQFTYRGHFGRVNSVAWSPNGQRLASVGSDKTLQIWDSVTGRKFFIHNNPSSTLTSVAWSYDGHYVATGGNDKLVQVWDTITRTSIATYAGHNGYITSVSWAPDGKQLVSASVDHTIHIWHL